MDTNLFDVGKHGTWEDSWPVTFPHPEEQFPDRMVWWKSQLFVLSLSIKFFFSFHVNGLNITNLKSVFRDYPAELHPMCQIVSQYKISSERIGESFVEMQHFHQFVFFDHVQVGIG